MALIDINKMTLVAVDSMNDTHREEVEMINAFYDKLKDKSISDSTINEDLDEIVHHTIEHFTKEEKNMLKYSFPPFPMHKGEHDRFLSTMTDYLDKWKRTNDRTVLIDFLENILVDWFYNHVMTMDRMTAMFLSNQGVK